MENEILSRSERNKKIYNEVYGSDSFDENEEKYEIEKDHNITSIKEETSEVLSREVYHKNKEYSRFFDNVDDELKTIEQKFDFTSVQVFEENKKDLKDLISKAKKQRNNDDKNTQYNILKRLELDKTQTDIQVEEEFYKTNELVSLKQGINDLEELIQDIESHTTENTFINDKPLSQEEIDFTFNLEQAVKETSNGFRIKEINTLNTNSYEEDLKLNLRDYMNESDEDTLFNKKNEQFVQVLIIVVVIIFIIVMAWAFKSILLK